MFAKWQAITLWRRVLLGLGLGLVLGLLLRYVLPIPVFAVPGSEVKREIPGADYIGQYWIYPIGQAFVRLIKMLIVPLVFTTLVSGVTAMGDPKRLGSLGLKTLGLYIATTFFAVALGLGMGTVIQPGSGVDYQSAATESTIAIEAKMETTSQSASLVQRLIEIIPENPALAFAEGQILPIIFFSIALGVGILLAGEIADPVRSFFDAASEVVLKLTTLIMELAPIGVAALMAWVMSTKGIGVLSSLLRLTAALYASCLLQIVLIYGLVMIRGSLGLPLKRFFKGIADAQGIAFSTASSSATLPVSISCAETHLGVKKSVAGSVLPLGATINMDGTAIYLGLVALFAAQACGVTMTFDKYVMVALLATFASIGAAGIPSAGLLLAASVIEVVGIPADQSVMVIAFIFPFDRLLDMMRTMTNVTGDLAVTCAVAKWEGVLDEDAFRRE